MKFERRIMHKFQKHTVCFFLFIFLSLSCEKPKLGAPINLLPFSKEVIERQKARADKPETEELLASLNIRKGMVILDVGAGAGQYTFKFADKLSGTGKVFATDVDPEIVKYLKSEVRAKGYKNVYPVLVSRYGVDDFYGESRYDLIFIAHSIHLINEPINFLRQMKRYLNPGGHLVVLTYKVKGYFAGEDFTDVDGLMAEVLNESRESPFYRFFVPYRAAIENIGAGREQSKQLIPIYVQIFNQMVQDAHLYIPFLSKSALVIKEDVPLLAQERDNINMNLEFLREYGVLDAQRGVDMKSKNINSLNSIVMRCINEAIVIQGFRRYLYGNKQPFLPGYKIPENIKELEHGIMTAGYKIIGEYDFIPYQVLMVFSAG